MAATAIDDASRPDTRSPPKNGCTARSCAPSVMAVEPAHGRSKTPQLLGRCLPGCPMPHAACHPALCSSQPPALSLATSRRWTIALCTADSSRLASSSSPMSPMLWRAPAPRWLRHPLPTWPSSSAPTPSITSAATSRSLLDNVRSLSCTATPRPGDAAALDLCPGAPSGP
jgi:hypothetical protein